MSVLFLWAIGVMKAQEAAIATAIRKASEFTLSLSAISMAIGAPITAVAVLFKTSDRLMITTIRTVSTTAGANPSVNRTMLVAISSVPPELSSATPNGCLLYTSDA